MYNVFKIGGKLAALSTLGLCKTSQEFAPGIPLQKPVYRLPNITPKTMNRWTVAVQAHDAVRAGKHWDLRLIDPDANKAHSWALPKSHLPEPGEKVLAVQTFTHTPEYALHFGENKPEIIPEGYGKGRVRMALKEPVDIVESNNDKVRFNIYQGKNNNEYILRRTHGNKWLLQNVTLTKDRSGVPQSKPKYKEVEPENVDMTNDEQLMTAKLDGSHCFCRNVSIITQEYGKMQIGCIVDNQLPVHVLSGNPTTKEIMWQKVIRYYKRKPDEPIYHIKIHADSVHQLRVTASHKIETPTGSKCVKDLNVGDTVLALQETLSPSLYQATLGMLIGDASISKNTSRHQFAITHSLVQQDYCWEKYKLLKHFCNKEPSISTYKNGYVPNSKRIRFGTKCASVWSDLHKLFYKPNRKITDEFLNQLTEISLAFWFMDDGHTDVADHTNRKNVQLALSLYTEAHTLEEVQQLVTWFKKRWNIHTRVNTNRGYHFIAMGAASTLQFLNLVAPWVHPCMRYKLGETYYKFDTAILDKLGTKWNEIDIKPQKRLCEASISYKMLCKTKVDYVYNLEVENTHKYIASNTLVGNCTFALNAGQPLRVFSYRPTERKTGIIEHTQRFLPGFQQRIPKSLDNLVLRGELFASDPLTGRTRDAVETGAILNSGVWRSRDIQQHSPLRAVIFDVARQNGKDVENIPYTEKLKILERVNKQLPFLELPLMANTAKDKINLLNRIRTGQEPITTEGVVLWPLGGGAPIKAKFRPDYDVYVREIFPETGKREGLAGGFRYSWTPRGKIVGHVGTGFNHALKRDMLENPQKYIGRVARTRALGVYRDKENPKKPGALRGASLSDWHLDKGYQLFEGK